MQALPLVNQTRIRNRRRLLQLSPGPANGQAAELTERNFRSNFKDVTHSRTSHIPPPPPPQAYPHTPPPPSVPFSSTSSPQASAAACHETTEPRPTRPFNLPLQHSPTQPTWRRGTSLVTHAPLRPESARAAAMHFHSAIPQHECSHSLVSTLTS